jgi:hypothetical protein
MANMWTAGKLSELACMVLFMMYQKKVRVATMLVLPL